MKSGRRQFLAGLGLAATGASLAKPALAQSDPEVRWTATSSFPPTLDIIYLGGEIFAQTVSALTNGRFTVSIAPAGEIAPALDAIDAVAAGKADCAHTALSYAWNKEPAYVFGTATPFGMNARQHAAWLQEGGGNGLIDDLLSEQGLLALPLGNTGGQMAGWFRKEIRSSADFKGLKIRIGGFAGKVLQTLGATPVTTPKEDLISALQSGALDAFEWVGPYDDEKFNEAKEDAGPAIFKVAPYYYYPGWWKGGMQLHLVVSKEKFAALPKTYQEAATAAAALANATVQAKYDASNPGALKRLVVGGAQLKLFSQEVMEACYKTANDLYSRLGSEDPKFKKLADSYMAFRADQYLWWQVAEYSFDNFMIRQRRNRS
jgi:TRAP-type mannitol/chloroaromatic compound transport system substrate-binding protein